MKSGSIALALAAFAAFAPLSAQEPAPASAPAATTTGMTEPMAGMQHAAPAEPQAEGAPHVAPAEGAAKVDIITPHITDGKHMELPSLNAAHGFAQEVTLPSGWPSFDIPLPIIGNFHVDTSPTKLIVMLWIVAAILIVLLVGAARSHTKRAAQGLPPKGMAGAIEAVILYMRNEVILPNVGHHGEGFVPYLLTIFFFILVANLLGLVPYMATATGNISVTATLAIMTFFVIEIAGMRALGKGYINTIIFWPTDMPLLMRIPISIILTPVEFASKLTKPFALAIRLFANMTAGHIVVLALIGLVFTFNSYLVAPAPVVMAVAIMLLELMVAFLQAFIFTLLSSVFIGLVRESHH
ncbi:MAG: F0F1 ATP synthase subunit A [Gemmatimonadota bacterium]|nr:F0F1 ATP synthase subunit A [Gemmatimonadota bacterium]